MTMTLTLDQTQQQAILDLTNAMADVARDIARDLFRSNRLDTQDKDDDSPVTVADKSIEAQWRAMIAAAFPDHSIMGEEYDDQPGTAPITWVLDPIDGTRQFVYGMPLFGSLIGVLEHGKPVVGCIEIPMMAERWIGAPSISAALNGQPARTSDCARLNNARMMATAPSMLCAKTREPFARLTSVCKDIRFGTDCYAAGLLASGYCDIYAEANLKPVDAMALIPVIEQAGGVVTDWQGAPYGLESDGNLLAAANAPLHALALAALAP